MGPRATFTYLIEIEHQRGPWWRWFFMPWSGSYWVGHFGRYDDFLTAHDHVNEKLAEAKAEAKNMGVRITGHWRIARHVTLDRYNPIVNGQEFDVVVLWGRGKNP